jgi:hypothetical protein
MVAAMTEHDARTVLARATTTLPAAELAVLAYVAQGLLTGMERFGGLYAGKREWAKETAEELRDAVVYLLAGQMDAAGMLPPPRVPATFHANWHGPGMCHRYPHTLSGEPYGHAADSDAPYLIEGIEWCGRCHAPLSA